METIVRAVLTATLVGLFLVVGCGEGISDGGPTELEERIERFCWEVMFMCPTQDYEEDCSLEVLVGACRVACEGRTVDPETCLAAAEWFVEQGSCGIRTTGLDEVRYFLVGSGCRYLR